MISMTSAAMSTDTGEQSQQGLRHDGCSPHAALTAQRIGAAHDSRLSALLGQLVQAGSFTGLVRLVSNTPEGPLFHDLAIEQGSAVAWNVVAPHSEPALECPRGRYAPLVHGALIIDLVASVDGERISLPAADEFTDDVFGEFPPLESATIDLEIICDQSPHGRVMWRHEIVDGRLMAAHDLRTAPPRALAREVVRLHTSWRQYLRLRAGHILPQDLLVTSRFDGRWQALLLLEGLVATPQFTHHAERAELALGFADSADWWVEAAVNLIEESPERPGNVGEPFPTSVTFARTPCDVKVVSRCVAASANDLLEWIAESVDARGWSLVVDHAGETVLDAHHGYHHSGRPVDDQTLWPVYCSAKPITAAAILRSVNDGLIGLEQPIGEVLDELGATWLAPRTIGEILSHSAGLHLVPATIGRMVPQALRTDTLLSVPPPEGFRFGIDGSYAEFGGWHILGELLKAVHGAAPSAVIRSLVTRPYGIADHDLIVSVGAESFPSVAARLLAHDDHTGPQRLPLLGEIVAPTLADENPAVGIVATSRAMTKFMAGLRADVEGAGVVLDPVLAITATSLMRSPIFDDVLARAAPWGLGVMVDLGAHGFEGGWSRTSFGHTAVGGSSFALADPERGVAACWTSTAILEHQPAMSLRTELSKRLSIHLAGSGARRT